MLRVRSASVGGADGVKLTAEVDPSATSARSVMHSGVLAQRCDNVRSKPEEGHP
jgi:hypothetical protein